MQAFNSEFVLRICPRSILSKELFIQLRIESGLRNKSEHENLITHSVTT